MKIETQWAFDWRDPRSGRKRQTRRWLPGGTRSSEMEAMRVQRHLAREHGAEVEMQAIDRRVI